MSAFGEKLIARTEELRDACLSLSFPEDVIPYHPLFYAWDLHRSYLERYVTEYAPLLFLGMNPGPFGMGQTGVPFGEISAVKNYLKITGEVKAYSTAHEKRPVTGLSCERSEVSGRRLWGCIEELYENAEDFPSHLSVMNYCPLLFAERGKNGKNIVPEKLGRAYLDPIEKVCDSYLDDIVALIQPKVLIGVGKYAEQKAAACAERTGLALSVTMILHPSPASPAANKGWKEKAAQQLKEADLWKYL